MILYCQRVQVWKTFLSDNEVAHKKKMNTPSSIHDTKVELITKTPIETITGRSPASSKNQQASLASGDLVYLYGDIGYRGTLIRPIECTYPAKWSVQLELDGYEAVNVQDISLVEFGLDEQDLSPLEEEIELILFFGRRKIMSVIILKVLSMFLMRSRRKLKQL
ncbi:MAG: hypothetical protein AAF383_10475 [Cyanobacteria bacterium P01_A01_bin.83]